MNHPTLLQWILANALGLGIGFFAYLQTGFLLDYGLDFNLHWQSDIPPSRNIPFVAVLTIPTMLVVAGVVLGFAQGFILRSFQIHMRRWIVTTSIGFLLLSVILMPLEHTGILGNIPGPVEPILFTVGGCSLAGVTQFITLRKRSVQATR